MLVAQANVGRGSAAHDIFLQTEADVLLVQEPWTSRPRSEGDPQLPRTKLHPRYQVYAPLTRWSPRPRVLTYVRRDLPVQVLPDPESPDLLALKVCGLTIINVYRPPDDPSTTPGLLRTLLSVQIPRKCLVAGDFNTYHPSWQSNKHPSSGAEQLVSWLEDNDLVLSLPPDTPTRGPNTIDLVFASVPARTSVEEHLHSTSDHETLLTDVDHHVDRTRPTSRPHNARTDWERARELLGAPSALVSPQEAESIPLDELAPLLFGQVLTALRAATPTDARRHPARAPWWTAEVKAARGQGRTALRRAVRAAKSAYWRKQIESASSPKEAFALARWNKKKDQLPSPPLRTTAGGRAVTAAEKADTFLAALLAKAARSSTDTTAHGPPARPIPRIPDPTLEECRAAVCGPPASAPGVDGMTTTGWTELWPVVGRTVHALFTRSLREGVVPHMFKGAKIIMIPKPGKRDLTDPTAHRPISLLNTLGKGLERFLARRIGVRAINSGILARTHFGALQGRSAVDLVQVLVHRIEKALAKGKSATLLLMDVKGAFDAVDHSQLLSHLRLQGWDQGLISWIRHWLTDRTCTLHVEDSTAAATPPGGLPQGSPLSPILFMLYMAHAINSRANTFGYADDLAHLAIGDSLEETTKAAEHAHNALCTIGAHTGLPFSPEKTEVQHFTRRRLRGPMPTAVLGARSVPPSEHTRWLGVQLDTKLTFRPHVKLAMARGKQLALFLRSLSNTQRGCPPLSMRTAVMQCVLPTALYAAEVFYPGDPVRCKWMVTDVQSMLRLGALAIVPAYRTAPTAALMREADLPFAKPLLEYIRQRAGARYHSLDADHPIARVQPTPCTRLGRMLSAWDPNVSPPLRKLIEDPRPPMPMLPCDRRDSHKAGRTWCPGPPHADRIHRWLERLTWSRMGIRDSPGISQSRGRTRTCRPSRHV